MLRLWGPLVAVLLTVAPLPLAAHSLEELQAELTVREDYVEFVDRVAPDFVLEDAEGQAVALHDLAGKVVVLWFIYAGCPDVCPLHSDKIAEVQSLVNQTPMIDRVAFVAITTDPVRDTPDVLAAYGFAHGLVPDNFSFLTSGAEALDATRALAERYGLKFTQEDDG